MSIMLAFSAVWRFMLDRTTKDRRFAFVSDDDMQNLQYMLGSAANPVLITADKLKVGQKVKVMRGALAGLEGWFYREAHTTSIPRSPSKTSRRSTPHDPMTNTTRPDDQRDARRCPTRRDVRLTNIPSPFTFGTNKVKISE